MRNRLLLLCLLLLLLVPCAALADVCVFENERLTLSVDTESLALCVTDRPTGGVLRGGAEIPADQKLTAWTGFLQSTLSIEVSKGNSTSATRVDMLTGEARVQILERWADGLACMVDFPQQGQRIRLELLLSEDSFSLTVPQDGIEEYGDTRLCGVYLLPCFGASRLKDARGYTLVPEAAGALIAWTDGQGIPNTPYVKRIYGENAGVEVSVPMELNRPAEKITMPLYGMVNQDAGLGYLAVVESGEEAAEIQAYPGGVITDYNWAGARFILREQYVQQTSRTAGLLRVESKADVRELAIRFYILSGDQADYSGMAQRYRRALLEAEKLKQRDTRYRPRLDFLGAESKKLLLWNALVPMTTAEQMRQILADYRDAGLSAPLVIYRGWHPGGLSLSYGAGSLAMERGLGTLEELDALRDQVEAENGLFLLEEETVLANTNRLYNTRLDVARTVGQSVMEKATGKELYPTFYYLTPHKSVSMLAAYQTAYGQRFPGLALSTLPNTLFSYYSGESVVSRQESMRRCREGLESLTGITRALQNPFAGYWDQTDIFLDMPLDTTSYSFLSAEVPFLPLVLNGSIPYYSAYCNDDANAARQLLKLVEYGAYPSYLITYENVKQLEDTNSCDIFCAQWDVIKDGLLARDARLRALYTEIAGTRMIRHDILKAEVVRLEYEDGKSVLINYGNEAYSWRGKTVPAMDYLLVKGGGEQ